ncbi:tyrosyl-DNA phosphodiesterase 1 [Cichlidogyrus casuarinus]|uniref:Tyrosyl-DNA phosphodiesterase 1 n=1 Tax=Cichlidogyrus casuarinus TaxID=1844966 RepID=A0ABD2QI12_9PLAT
MTTKEAYPEVDGGDLFDIPAAQEEVTVGANEQENHYNGDKDDEHSQPQLPAKRPKIIMLQRSSLGGAAQIVNGHLPIPGQPGIKTVKIIKVGAAAANNLGVKPGKPSVIPLQLLNKNLKLGNAIGGPKIFTLPGGHMGQRVLTIRSNQANNPQIVVSSANYLQSQIGQQEDVENQMIDLGGHQHMQSGGQLIELAPGPPGSPGRDFDTSELDPSLNQPLKTNGLRRYARCVCNKVKEKGVTSYSEVADELVHEYAAEHPMIPSEQLHYIQKNIRRRVYDALNVLMALNVLQKEKKEIHWVGLPVNMIEECKRLEEEREKRQISLRNKTNEIQDLILQLIAFKNLVVRNQLNEQFQQQQLRNAMAKSKSASGKNEMALLADGKKFGFLDRIKLPFLVVITNKKTVVDTLISEDRLQYVFSFDQGFEIRDDVEILKRMGLTLHLGTSQCQQNEFDQCLDLVPPSMRFYVEAIKARRQAIVPDFEALHVQRRMYVEARLANEMQQQEGSAGNGYHDDTESNAGVTPVGKQIHFQQREAPMPSSRHMHSQDLMPEPGDTQHYARAAANRGYVVPGGPGSSLRNRQLMMDENGSLLHPADEALMQTTADLESRRIMREQHHQEYLMRRQAAGVNPDEEDEMPPDVDEDDLPEEDEDDADMEDVEY